MTARLGTIFLLCLSAAQAGTLAWGPYLQDVRADRGYRIYSQDGEKIVTVFKTVRAANGEIPQSEVDRYVVMPGQACSYKIGMLKILELRAEAKQKLGAKFSVPAFHDVVLRNGAVPLVQLEKIVREWIAEG